MHQHLADGGPLLAVAPAGHEAADRVVEAEDALFPELQHRDGGQRLARRVPEHDVVGLQGPARAALAHGGVEQDLAAQGDVELGAVVEAVAPLGLEQLGHGREPRCRVRPGTSVTGVKFAGHGAEA